MVELWAKADVTTLRLERALRKTPTQHRSFPVDSASYTCTDRPIGFHWGHTTFDVAIQRRPALAIGMRPHEPPRQLGRPPRPGRHSAAPPAQLTGHTPLGSGGPPGQAVRFAAGAAPCRPGLRAARPGHEGRKAADSGAPACSRISLFSNLRQEPTEHPSSDAESVSSPLTLGTSQVPQRRIILLIRPPQPKGGCCVRGWVGGRANNQTR